MSVMHIMTIWSDKGGREGGGGVSKISKKVLRNF